MAPLFAYRASADRDIRRATLLGELMLTVGYLMLGATNATFGILPQTTLFALLLGLLVAMAQSGSSEPS